MMVMGVPVRSRDQVHNKPQYMKVNAADGSDPLAQLPERAIQSLTGNGMHAAVVGVLVLCILKNVQPKPPTLANLAE